MNDHYCNIRAWQVQAEYRGRREGDWEPSVSFSADYEGLSDDFLTLFNGELHQEYWGDDEGYILNELSNEASNPQQLLDQHRSPSRIHRLVARYPRDVSQPQQTVNREQSLCGWPGSTSIYNSG